MNKIFPFGLALSLLGATACGDDGGDETGGGTDTGSTSAPTTDPSTTSTTDPSTSTTDPSTSTTDPSTSSTTDPTTGETSGSTGGAEEAQIRVMHLGVGVDGVDVFVDDGDMAAFSNLTFGNSTEYAVLPPGMYEFDVAPTGMTAADAVLTQAATLADGDSVTAVAIGDPNDAGDPTELAVLVIPEDYDGIAAGQFRLTIAHAATLLEDVDIYEISDAQNPAELLADVPFGAAATLATDLDTGTYEIGVDDDNDTGNGYAVTFTVDASAAGGAYINAYAQNDDQANVNLTLQFPDGTTADVPAN